MFASLEGIIVVISTLILLSVFASKISDKFGVPALLLFIFIGMLAGTEGLGRINFNDLWFAKSVGIVALIFIIFYGGIDTTWKETKQVLPMGIVLSTFGVLFTAIIVSVFTMLILGFSFNEGLLLGAIIASTDAAAVFSILRSKKVNLKEPLKPLLELESGSNDPMAVFLTIGMIKVLMNPGVTLSDLFPMFLMEMGIGALAGYLLGRVSIFVVNKLHLPYSGLYPVLSVALIMFTFGVTSLMGGNGFLAVYAVGLLMGKESFIRKKTIIRFHEGLAWLVQIMMFVTLGLLVLPSQILPVIGAGILTAVVLMFVARPISVFMCLLPFRLKLKKKAMVAWVGLRGAVPIILAIFPLIAGVPKADFIFSVVFFVVFTSVLIQGTSITFVAKWLKVLSPEARKRKYPIEFEKIEGIDAELTEVIVPYDSPMAGKSLFRFGIPQESLIVLIARGDKFIVPNGATIVNPGDVLLVLANEKDLDTMHDILAKGYIGKKE